MKSPPIITEKTNEVSTLIKLNINRLMLSSTLTEENGELAQAILNHNERKSSKAHIITEAVQTAAMALRFLKNLDDTDLANAPEQ